MHIHHYVQKLLRSKEHALNRHPDLLDTEGSANRHDFARRDGPHVKSSVDGCIGMLIHSRTIAKSETRSHPRS